MTPYDDTNRGSLWRNERKTEKVHSDLKGKINIGGTMHWFDGYIKEPGANPLAPEIKVIIGAPCDQQGAPQSAPLQPPAMLQPTAFQGQAAPAQQAPQQQYQQQAPQQAAPQQVQQQPQVAPQQAAPLQAVPGPAPANYDEDIPF